MCEARQDKRPYLGMVDHYHGKDFYLHQKSSVDLHERYGNDYFSSSGTMSLHRLEAMYMYRVAQKSGP